MALRCSNCGRFVSANYPCTNSRCTGIDVKVPVVYKNKPSRSSSSVSFDLPSSQEYRSSFACLTPLNVSFESDCRTLTSGTSSSTMSCENLSNIRESFATIKDQIALLQTQMTNLKSENQGLKQTREELKTLLNNLKKETEQKIQEAINYFKDALNQEKIDRKETMTSFDKRLNELNHIREVLQKSYIVLQEKLFLEETAHKKADADHFVKINDLEKSKESILQRCTVLEEKLRFEEMAREEFCSSSLRKMDQLIQVKELLEKRCIIIEEKLCYEEAANKKVEADNLKRIRDLVKSCTALEEKVKFGQELCVSSVENLKKDKWNLIGRCNSFEEQMRQGELTRREIMDLGSELRGRMVSLERKQLHREIIIIILVLIICWTLFQSFVTRGMALSRYTFDKYKQLT